VHKKKKIVNALGIVGKKGCYLMTEQSGLAEK